ncbi:putative MFS family arabinose efflux permease [Actinoplanes italicus]|uniref:Putative MFS family arabinose efflux permease n=2 Tax=Actinoplanes italicus TaxID=113567 RepID=A0A2T0K215_9ACTN|nr:putative MFS family arabinose efflux permease [Actinoplanes italicus]
MIGATHSRRMALLEAPVAPRTRTGSRAGFWAVAFAFAVAMAFSTVPAPLYPLYGFSTFTVTLVFAAYAVGVVASLVLAGHVSDRLGRRRVLVPALGLELVAAVLFLAGDSVPLLLVARFVTGLGVGMITATATAYLHELHAAERPGAPGTRFEVVSTAANIGGLGLGTLVAGVLAQFVTAPLRTPYAVFVVLIVAAVAAVTLAPETVRPSGAYRYRPQRVTTGRGPAYLAAATGAFAAFSVFGFFTSVAPGFVAGTLHQPSRALAGLIVFAVFGGSAVAQTLTTALSARSRTTLGLSAQAAGTTALVSGMHLASLPVFLIGGLLAAAGAGVLFKASIGTVAALAAPQDRGAALAGLFLIAYVALAVSALAIGLAALVAPVVTVMTWFAVALLVMLTAVATLTRRPS